MMDILLFRYPQFLSFVRRTNFSFRVHGSQEVTDDGRFLRSGSSYCVRVVPSFLLPDAQSFGSWRMTDRQ